MREEWTKKTSEIDGVPVFDQGNEFVFILKNKKGADVEYHITKPVACTIAEQQINLAKEIKKAKENLAHESAA